MKKNYRLLYDEVLCIKWQLRGNFQWDEKKPLDLEVYYIQCIVNYEALGAIFLKCYVRLKESGGEEDQIFNLLNSRSTENKSYKLRYCRISLCDPMDYSPPVSSVHGIFQYWSGLPVPSPRDHPDPGIKPGSPTLQADSLLSEPPGKPQDKPTI